MHLNTYIEDKSLNIKSRNARNQTWFDVLKQNVYIIISVIATLFVVEAQSVEKLMLNNADCITISAGGDRLST